MKKKRTTLEQFAIAAGMPKSKAKDVVGLDPDRSRTSPILTPEDFLTREEQSRRIEIENLALLRRLLDLAHDTSAGTAPGGPNTEATEAWMLVTHLASNHIDTDGPRPRIPSNAEASEFINECAVELKRVIEGRSSGVRWKIPLDKVSKVLSWDVMVHGGAPYRSPDWRTACLLGVAHRLDLYGSHIRQCERADCARLFLADDLLRQKFCSRRCGEIVRERRFREEHPNWKEYRSSHRKALKENSKQRKPQQAKLAADIETKRSPKS